MSHGNCHGMPTCFMDCPARIAEGIANVGNESHSESLCLYRRAFKPGGGGRNLGCAWLRMAARETRQTPQKVASKHSNIKGNIRF